MTNTIIGALLFTTVTTNLNHFCNCQTSIGQLWEDVDMVVYTNDMISYSVGDTLYTNMWRQTMGPVVGTARRQVLNAPSTFTGWTTNGDMGYWSNGVFYFSKIDSNAPVSVSRNITLKINTPPSPFK